MEPGWHNWLARETFMLANLKVEGSSPSSGEVFLLMVFILLLPSKDTLSGGD